MDIRSVDLNLLVVFEAMLSHRSVTRAAEALGLSQPAMSAAVARLRGLFDDPLFVRSGAQMAPTARANELAPAVHRVIEMVKGEILQGSHFEPALTQRRFTLLMPDIGEVLLVPRLLARIAKEAPNARLCTLPLPRYRVPEALESGDADMALGPLPDLQRSGFHQHRMGQTTYCCIVRKGHPLFAQGMTLARFEEASHVVVRPDGRASVFEQMVPPQGRRRVAVELTHFMSLLPVISGSDLISVVPQHLGDYLQSQGPIVTMPLPFKSPILEVHQTWHQQVHKDPANIWLRGLVRELYT